MRSRNGFCRQAAYWLTLGFLLAVSVLLLFENLGTVEIQRADEAQHGINAYEMMKSGNYLVNTYLGEVDYWNLKPPLSFYGIMLGYHLFGFTPFALRFYSAASMLGLMIVMALWMKRRHGSAASLITQLAMMACGVIYGEHFARFGDADSLYVFFYTLSMLCMLQSTKDLRWLYGSAVGFGLAFMTKSWHAALIPVTCFLFVCITGRIRHLKLKNYLLLIVFGLLPIAPWAIARMRFDGLTFFQKMIEVDVLKRASQVVEDHYGEPLFYVKFLLSEPTVWLGLLFCLPVLLRRLFSLELPNADQAGLVLWFGVPVLFYSLCASMLRWYVFVCFPAVAIALGILVGKWITHLPKNGKMRALRLVSVACCAVILLGLTGLNLHHVSSLYCNDLYDKLIFSIFNPERDSGKHMYITYEAENSYRSNIDHTICLRDEVLSAMLAGDMICIDGGAKAFAADPEPAYLIAHEVGLEEDLLQDFTLAMTWPPLRVYKNHPDP